MDRKLHSKARSKIGSRSMIRFVPVVVIVVKVVRRTWPDAVENDVTDETSRTRAIASEMDLTRDKARLFWVRPEMSFGRTRSTIIVRNSALRAIAVHTPGHVRR